LLAYTKGSTGDLDYFMYILSF